MLVELLPWALFLALVAGLLALDLGVFHREAHEVQRREALIWSVVWIGLAVVFNAAVFWFMGSRPASSGSPATWSRSRWPSTTSSSFC